MVPIEGMSYEQVLAAVHHRIAGDRRAGGYRAEFIRGLDDREHLDQHVTETRRVGDPCVRCCERWPCGPLMLVLSPE